MKEKIAVLIPCYNEELTIRSVVEDFKKVIPQADIYVYDNNSKDNTAKIAKEAGAITLNYGSLINAILNFLIVSVILFILVKTLAKANKKKNKEVEITTKTCPYCMSTINIKATRCPNCTSILEETSKENE